MTFASGELTGEYGQQDQPPAKFLQQVVPSGHCLWLSQRTDELFSSAGTRLFSTSRERYTGTTKALDFSASFITMGILNHGRFCFSHSCSARLQVYPEGQQWAMSEQHTAWQRTNEEAELRGRCQTQTSKVLGTHIWIWTAVVSFRTLTASVCVWTLTPIGAFDTGHNPQQNRTGHQTQSELRHLQRKHVSTREKSPVLLFLKLFLPSENRLSSQASHTFCSVPSKPALFLICQPWTSHSMKMKPTQTSHQPFVVPGS